MRGSGRSRRLPRASRLAGCLGILLLAGALLAGSARAEDAPRVSKAAQWAFEAWVEQTLQQAGLDLDRLALLLYSTREGRYLYQHNMHKPMIAASNAKLATTYAALRVLTPDYRWRTRFFRVEEHDAAGGAPRQGLLVEGTGDPTLTGADLQRVAWVLRSHGVNRLEGGIYFDGRRFDDQKFPASWGDVSKAQPWFAPVSPFIVDKNIIQFMIASRHGTPGFDIFTSTPGFRIVSALQTGAQEQPAIRVEQQWSGDSATFVFQGSLAPAAEPVPFSAAVERPQVHFYQQLKAALRMAGIQGAMPLRSGPAPEPLHPLHTELSPPLREVLLDVNKNSSNLGAEVLLRTMGLNQKSEGVSAADGLAVLRRVMAQEFPEAPQELRLVDGSGLSRDNRISALMLVRLLNHVQSDFGLRPEFINSLSVALTDGTLQYRNYPWRMRGRMRAKTGTLAGVSNISGYLQLSRDVVVFSLLINDPSQTYQALQDDQDRVMSELYDALLAREAGEVLGRTAELGAAQPGGAARTPQDAEPGMPAASRLTSAAAAVTPPAPPAKAAKATRARKAQPAHARHEPASAASEASSAVTH
jgi:D-alanyl-D-alanine carboxypeptidase/D-alanyl-D-alanine-endopeptidase (penicillin-binding protein 4)